MNKYEHLFCFLKNFAKGALAMNNNNRRKQTRKAARHGDDQFLKFDAETEFQRILGSTTYKPVNWRLTGTFNRFLVVNRLHSTTPNLRDWIKLREHVMNAVLQREDDVLQRHRDYF